MGNRFKRRQNSFESEFLYACDTGDLEFIKRTSESQRFNLQKPFVEIWYEDENYYVEMSSNREKQSDLVRDFKNKTMSIADYSAKNKKLQKEAKDIDVKYSKSCRYNSRLDAGIRSALETDNMDIINYLVGLDLDYRNCTQSFIRAIETNNLDLVKFFISKGINMNQQFWVEPLYMVVEKILSEDEFISMKIRNVLEVLLK